MSANPAERAVGARQLDSVRGRLPADGAGSALVLAPAEHAAPARPDLGDRSNELLVSSGGWRLPWALIVAGAVLAWLLAAFIVLYQNFPAAHQALYGLSVESPAVFAPLWPYPTLQLEPQRFALLATITMVALWVVYLVAWVTVQTRQDTKSLRAAIATIAAFSLLYHLALTLFMSPILSMDIYHYALFGRMAAFYGLNPYVVPGDVIPNDPFWDLAGWQYVTTHYGPLWTMLSAAVVSVAGDNVPLTVIAFKAVAALFNLANCLLVFLLARALGHGNGVGPLLLYAWNPLVLIETAGSGHNDTAMMTFALLGLLLAVRGHLLLGLAALVLAVLTKYLTAILLLFLVLHCLVSQPTWRRRTMLAAKMGAVAALLTVTLFLPFWAGPDGFERLVTVGAPFKTAVRLVLRNWLANLLANGREIGLVRAALEPSIILGLHTAYAGFILLLARLIVVRKPDWSRLLELWGLASLVYLMVVYGWNLPWFLVIPLATTCAALHSRASYRLLAVCHGFGFALMLPYAVVLPA